MQSLITNYCNAGGNIFVSGSYLGSDMNTNPNERTFTENILKYRYDRSIRDSYSGQVYGMGRTMEIPRMMNEKSYAVPAPESIIPIAPAFSSFIYTDGNRSAGTAYKGSYRTFVLGFPFESIISEQERARVMSGILGFFSK